LEEQSPGLENLMSSFSNDVKTNIRSKDIVEGMGLQTESFCSRGALSEQRESHGRGERKREKHHGWGTQKEGLERLTRLRR
jgi:hypothetical protein